MPTSRHFVRYLLGTILGLSLAGGIALAVSVLSSIAGPAASATPTCTDTFNNTVGDSEWGNPGNWSTKALPGSADVACLGASVTTVYFDTGNTQSVDDVEGGTGVLLQVLSGQLNVLDTSNTSTLGSLEVTYGTVQFSGPTTISSGVTLSGGTLEGAGAVSAASLTWTAGDFYSNNTGSLTVSGMSTISTGTATQTWYMQGYTLNADGGATFTSSGVTNPGFQLQYSGAINLAGTSTIPGGYDISESGNATITVAKGATLEDTGASGSTVTIGPTLDDNGTVTLQNNGVTFDAYDGSGPATSSGIIESTAGSTLELSGQNLTSTSGAINPAASPPGTDTLEINNSTVSGPFTVGTLETDALQGTTTFSGGFDVNTLLVSGSTFAMNGPSSTYTVATSVTLDGGTISGSADVSTPLLSWSSGDFSSSSGGQMTVSGMSTISTGTATQTWYMQGYTLNADGGATFTSSGVTNPGFQLQYSGAINLAGTSTMPAGYLVSGSSGNSVNLVSGASLTIGGPGAPTQIDAPFTTSGSVTIPSGSVVDFSSYSQSSGTTTLAAASSQLQASPVNLTGGVLEGDGEVAGAVDNSGGTVQPGNGTSPGTLDIVGAYTQSAGGTLVSDIAGATAGSGYGQLVATSASLAGTLDVTDEAGFQPTGSDVFDVVDAPVGDVSGTFGTVTPTGFGGPDNVTYTTTAVEVTFNVLVTPTVTITATSADSVYGQSVTFTATVTGASGAPTGTIQFKDGTSNLGPTETLASGAASYKTQGLSVGTHSITADYSGNTSYLPGTSAAYDEKVLQVGTAMSFSPNVNPAGAGQTVSLIAIVTAKAPSSAVPTGTVTFYRGTTKLGTAKLVGGVATFATTFKAGTYSLKATYPSSSDFGASQGTSSITVKSFGSKTAIKESTGRVLTNIKVKFTATVKTTSGKAVSSGKVEFFNGLKKMGTAVSLNSSGIATLNYSFSSPSSYSITAKFLGSSTLGGSQSSAVKLLVQEQGYRMVGQDGGVFDFGGAGFYGSLPKKHIKPASPVVAIANTPDGLGYWIVTSGTGTTAGSAVYAFGDAKQYSADQSGKPAGVVTLLPTHDGKGYWLVTSAGAVFRYGDAKAYGSKSLSGVVGAAVTPDGKGYWMVTSAGKVYAFGDAKTYSAISGQGAVSGTISAMSPTLNGKGYYLVNTAGHVYCFGDAKSYGSVKSPTPPITGIAVDAYGNGLWAAGANGSVYALGSAPNFGGVSKSQLTAQISGLAMFP